MHTLRLISGPSAAQVVSIERELVIGREGADLSVDDPEVSRRHAALRPVEGGVQIEDLGSSNGTFVDGRRVSRPVTVNSTARVRVGKTELEIEPEAPAGAPTRITAGPRRPPVGAALGALGLAMIVIFALAARGEGTETHDVRLVIRTTELYFVPPRIGFSGTVEGEPFGLGTITQDQTFGGPPEEILQGPTPVFAKVIFRFPDGTLTAILNATATPTAAGGTDLEDVRIELTDSTGEYEGASGVLSATGGRPNIEIPIARFESEGQIEW